MFYAGYCAYGTNISYSSLNGGAWRFFAFSTKKQRTEFLNKYTYDKNNNIVATCMTARGIRLIVGSNYVFENMFSDPLGYEIYKHDFYEIEFDRSRLVNMWFMVGWIKNPVYFL